MFDYPTGIIALNPRTISSDPMRLAVQEIETPLLLTTADNLIRLATQAADDGEEEAYFERIRAAFLCLERLVAEQPSA